MKTPRSNGDSPGRLALAGQGVRALARAAWPFRELGQRDAIFSGAEVSRLFLDWAAGNRSADEELRWSNPKLRARARDLARNDGYTKKFLLMLGSNVIGPGGFSLQSKVKRNGELWEEVNSTIEEAWKRFWIDGRVTVDGKLTGVPFEQLLLKGTGRDGEQFIRIYRGFEENPHGLAFQGIDPDMLDENFNIPAGQGRNEVRLGVEVNGLGRPLAFHFTRATPGRTDRERVPASDIIHLYIPERLNQTRGLTWFHSIMGPLKMLGGYEEAEVVAARTAAAKMGFFQARDGALSDLSGDLSKSFTMDAAPGKLEQIPAGWEFVGWTPEHPVSAYAQFVKGVLRKISTGLGVSYNALADDLEGVNYSSMRSGLLIERELWRLLQAWWIVDFRQIVFREWLPLALLTGALVLPTGRDPRGMIAPKWTARGWSWVDPLKDVQAAVQAIAAGMGSRSQYLAEQGLDFEGVLDEIVREEELAKLKGVDISAAWTKTKADDEET